MSKSNIFPSHVTLTALNEMVKNTMMETIGIEFTEIGEGHISARMPVDHRTHQPMGLLHGGASVTLAESLGSLASSLLVDLTKQAPVGLEINANHIKSARKGYVTGRCEPIHVGRSTHIWEIRITNEEEKLVCVSRLTVALVDHK